MNEGNRTTRSRRLNLRGVLILGIGCVIVVASVVGLAVHNNRNGTSGLLREAKLRWEQKQPSLALGYLGRYLELKPNDLDALDLKAEILAATAQEIYQAQAAVPIHQQILGKDAGRQETRRRLLVLTLRLPGRAKEAETLARELIRRGADDAEAHRLLANALQLLGEDGDTKALQEACREYEQAEKRAPGDVAGGERLAMLYKNQLNNEAKAREVLDQLVANNQKSPEKLAAAHLARARFFNSFTEADRVRTEIDQAVQADPKSLEARLMAAQTASIRGDIPAARAHLAAIPESDRDSLRVKTVAGIVDLREHRLDDTVESWRAGLLQTGGNDADLTFSLAQFLLFIGRTQEAEPLIDQYQRLAGGDEPNSYYHYLHAFALLKKSRSDEALKELEGIVYKSDKQLEPVVYKLIGECHEALRDEEKALAAYRKASDLLPNLGDSWLAIARILWPKHHGEAIDTLELGLKAVPGEPRLLGAEIQYLWLQQMEQPAAQRSWSDVEKAIERARKVAPGALEVLLAEADVLFSREQYEALDTLLRDATKANPKVVPLWTTRAKFLSRRGQTAEALKVIDQALADAGPSALLIESQAALLLSLGHIREARAAMEKGLDIVPAYQKAELWRALGDFHTGRNDLIAARKAFQEYAKLVPDKPEPHIQLVDLAIALGDEAGVRAEAEALKAVGGPKSPYARVARIQELLQIKPKEPLSPRDAADRLQEAGRLAHEIEADNPRLPLGYSFEGQVLEKQGNLDGAIKAYRRAVDLGGGQSALAPLVDLLIREGRDDELDRLRKETAVVAPRIDRLSVAQALKTGNKDRAERLADQLVKGDAGALDARLWQAQVLRALGRPEKAEAALQTLTTQQPTETGPWIQLLMLQVYQRRLDDAVKTVDAMRKHAKAEFPELLWAQCYRVAEDYPRADEFYREALRKWPDQLPVRIAVITYCEQTNRRAEAERMLRKVVENDPALTWATHRLALSLASHTGDLGAWSEALRLVGSGPKSDDNPDDRLVRAKVYMEGPEPRHREQALTILEQLQNELPQSPVVHELMARIHSSFGRRAEALKHAEIAAGPNGTPEAILLYTKILLDGNALDDAEKQLARLIELDPHSLPVAEMRARILIAKNQKQEAASVLEQTSVERLKTLQDLPTGQKMIALLVSLKAFDSAERVARLVGKLGIQGECTMAEYLAMHGPAGHDAEEAAAILESVAKNDGAPEAGTSALVLASVPKADPRWAALAEKFLTAARQKAPNSIDLIQKEAALRRLQGRYKEENQLYETMLTLKPRDYQFLNNMAWGLSEDLNDPRAGLKRINQALDKMGPQPHLLDTRAVILSRLGQYGEAITDLDTALRMSPSGAFYFHLARIYQKQGKTEEFHKARDRARAAGLIPEQLAPSERADWAQCLTN